jgi:hypothetical protein
MRPLPPAGGRRSSINASRRRPWAREHARAIVLAVSFLVGAALVLRGALIL